jgi:hypothetical protein
MAETAALDRLILFQGDRVGEHKKRGVALHITLLRWVALIGATALQETRTP